MRKMYKLYSSPMALLLAAMMALFPYAGSFLNTELNEGVIIGTGAAFFDPYSLLDYYQIGFTAMPGAIGENALKAITNGDVKHIILCLDLSEASGQYSPIIPENPSNTEKIGDMAAYNKDYGSLFEVSGREFRLDKSKDAIKMVTTIVNACKEKKIKLTVVFTPLHQSRWGLIRQKDIEDYKTNLSKITDFWDFSYSSVSLDSRYFYTPDTARTDICNLMLKKMSGAKDLLFADFGTLVTKSNIKSFLKTQAKEILPANIIGRSTDVPSLLYHNITENAQTRADVTPETFRAHMQAIKDAGYNTVTALDMINYVEHGKPLPENPIFITLDDGYLSNYEYAYPILKELDMRATIFAIGSSIGATTYKDTGLPITPHFTMAQAEEMISSGVIEIQSHTYDMHQAALYELGPARETATPLAGESAESYKKALIADYEAYNLSSKWGFYALAYPKGQYTETAEQLFRQLGIKMTVSTTTDRANTLVVGLTQSLNALCRYDIPNEMTAGELISLIK